MSVAPCLDAVLLERVRDARSCRDLEEAWAARVPSGRAAGVTLRDLAGDSAAAEWLAWAARREPGHWPGDFERALRLVCGRWPQVGAARLGQGAGDDEGRGGTS